MHVIASPFDQAFCDDLGQVAELDSLTILNTTAQDAQRAPLANFKRGKSLRIINQGKLGDVGLAQLAGLNRLEELASVGTSATGSACKDFICWANLKQASFRGSRLNDAGVIAVVEHFPNREHLSLDHAHFTDTGRWSSGGLHIGYGHKTTGLDTGKICSQAQEEFGGVNALAVEAARGKLIREWLLQYPGDGSVLPVGRKFSVGAELRRLLVADTDKRAAAAIEKLATYALRRTLTIDDRQVLTMLLVQNKVTDYRLRDLAESLVLSELFQQR